VDVSEHIGYAATTDIRNVPVVVVDADRSPASQALISRFSASGIFTLVDVVSNIREVDPYLEGGRAWMALAIPPRYGENVAAGQPATLQIVADGSDASSTNIAIGYAGNLVAGYAEELLETRARASGMAGAMGGGIDPRVRIWFNPALESRYFMLPGIFALLLLVVTSNLSSMAVVRERETGTLEQLNVTPLGRVQLIFGKLLPYAAIGMIDAMIVLAVIVFWFHVPLRGSFWLLIAMSLVYLLTTLGLGLFISTISNTQQQAMMTSTFFFMTPMMYLSGFVFPIENMPAAIQPLTYLIPLRYFVIILRGIFLKGVGLEILWPQALALFAWGAVILTLAILRSSKRLA
jgi:ABC-2 type transport system permease protein